MIRPFKGISPKIAESAFIAEGAVVIGEVTIGKEASIWYNCVVRGDVNFISIGERTNIQDGTIVHVATADGPTLIGNDVLIGHAAIIHGCTLEDGCFIGMAATVMDNAVVEREAMVAAGALVTPGKRVKARQLWAGAPAKFMRELTEIEVAQMKVQTARYADLADAYRTLLAQ